MIIHVQELLDERRPAKMLEGRSHTAVADVVQELRDAQTSMRRMIQDHRDVEWRWPLGLIALLSAHLYVTAMRPVYLFSGVVDVLVSLMLMAFIAISAEDILRLVGYWRRLRRLKYLAKLVENERQRRVTKLRGLAPLSKDDQRRLDDLESA